jgi:hypothetical protein
MPTAPQDHEAPPIAGRPWLVITIAVVALGAGFRVAQYASRQSFWGDEAALLFNITGKTTAALMTGPLDHGQAAPPAFLAVQRGIAVTLGTGEYAQRLPPLLIGIACPALAAWLAWRWTTPAGAAFVAAALAVSDAFIWQSATLKPYSGDVLLAIILLLIYPPPQDRGDGSGRRLIIASLVASLAVWYSLVITFVFAGISAVALAEVVRRRSGRTPWLLGNVLFACSFVALYVVSIRHQNGDAYLRTYWTFAFPDWSRPATLPKWFATGFWDLAGYVGWPMKWLAAVVLPLAVVGFISLRRQGKSLAAAALLAPVLMTVAAALLHQYPWTGRRVTMFLVPGIVVLAGAGVAGLMAMPQRGARALAALGLVPVLAPLAVALPALITPRTRTHLRPVIEYVRAKRAPGEPLFVNAPRLEFEWYWPDAPPPVSFEPPSGSASGTRIWYVVVPTNLDPPRYKQPSPDDVRRAAREIDRFVVRGGEAYRFEWSAATTVPTSTSASRDP